MVSGWAPAELVLLRDEGALALWEPVSITKRSSWFLCNPTRRAGVREAGYFELTIGKNCGRDVCFKEPAQVQEAVPCAHVKLWLAVTEILAPLLKELVSPTASLTSRTTSSIQCDDSSGFSHKFLNNS